MKITCAESKKNVRRESDHPVSSVKWIDIDKVEANDYNPNSVAEAEMKLLYLSIDKDGFTQPIVTWLRDDGVYEVVDGFHRYTTALNMQMIRVPIVVVNPSSSGRGDRIASTVRHNRARGKHAITSMSDLVLELSRRNWTDKKIAKELGMDQDEVLRLKQITGLASLFEDSDFSEAWNPDHRSA